MYAFLGRIIIIAFLIVIVLGGILGAGIIDPLLVAPFLYRSLAAEEKAELLARPLTAQSWSGANGSQRWAIAENAPEVISGAYTTKEMIQCLNRFTSKIQSGETRIFIKNATGEYQNTADLREAASFCKK